MGARAQLTKVTPRKLWFTVAATTVFGTLDLLSQLVDDDSVAWGNISWLRAVTVPVAVLVLTWVMLSVLDRAQDNGLGDGVLGEDRGRAHVKRRRIRLISTVAFAAPFVSWLVQYLVYWPMASMNDTEWILDSPIGAANQHPLAYNLTLTIIVAAGEAIGRSTVAGIIFASLVQLTVCAVLVAVVARYLLHLRTHPAAVWLLIAYATLTPLVGNYSFALVKDTVFSVCLVALIPVMLEIFTTRGTALHRWVFSLLAGAVFVGFAVMRNNGLPVLLLVLVVIVLLADRARTRAVLLSVITLVLAFLPTVATSMKFDEPKSVEWVGVPLQQIGYTFAHDPTCIPGATHAHFERIMPARDWAAAWVPASVDPTKDSPHFNRDTLQSDLGGFIRAWGSTALACPAEFTAGYLAHTKQLWSLETMNAGQTGGQSYFTEAVSNHPANRDALIASYAERGVVNESVLPDPVQSVLEPVITAGMKLTPGAGTWLWLMLFTIVGFAYRRRHEWIAIYTPSLLIWLTLLAAAPAVYPFRYVQFAMLVAPIGLALLFGTPRVPRGDSPAATVPASGPSADHGVNSDDTWSSREPDPTNERTTR